MGVSLLAKPAKWARNTTHGTYHILPKRGSSPHDMSCPSKGITLCQSLIGTQRKVPMQHQHSRATLESYLNARNIMAKELKRKLYPLDHDPLH